MTARNLPEWTGKTPNAAIPPRVQLRIYERDGGRCQNCTRKVGIGYEPFDFDHITALVNGGKHAESNIQLLCKHCHAGKTREDVAEKSRAYRKKAAHYGVKKPKKPIPGSKRSGWKHKLDGTWERRT